VCVMKISIVESKLAKYLTSDEIYFRQTVGYRDVSATTLAK